ncbi:hypothetical protein FQA39_LY01403 [Lamprigera yunnana]|nr:hypothetical protein FQA39_LY01403 [Lamprigera yunnana]
MGVTSKTGLLASTTNKIIRSTENNQINLRVVARTAQYNLKPLAGIYNPYPYRCSLLCNHPTDIDAKELLKKAKDTWANEGKNLLLSDEVEAIRDSLNQLQVKVTNFEENRDFDDIESVPEELFRRYTETDSRPLTPAPTLVSAHTRASGSRRCVTPDPILNANVHEKTQLVLDLRRSHSQETFSCYGIALCEIPSILVENEDDFKSATEMKKKIAQRSKTPSPIKTSKNDSIKIEKTYLKVTSAEEENEVENDEDQNEDDGIIKRRGRKRRKRGRDASRGPPAFQSSIDPETQVATIDPESHNPSARPSLIPNDNVQLLTETVRSSPVPSAVQQQTLKCDSTEMHSFLDTDILKLLHRELNEEIIDNEFNMKRRLALEEAWKIMQPKKILCKDLKNIQKEITSLDMTEKFWLNTPRIFSRTSARFELPMDSRKLNVLTPLQYVAEHVCISGSRKQLYNYIFNQHKDENGVENDHQRILLGKNIISALKDVMSNNMGEEQISIFRNLIGWTDNDAFSFKTFCGLSALCERIFAPEYPLLIKPQLDDPCHEIETIDFKSLEKKLNGLNVDERLVKILYAIRDS